jgi:single-stranded DNA-specific DHH superfamily exonuclease
MIPKQDIHEIREILNKSTNPLFFYDDDPDGLVSYLLLRKHFKKGRGIVVKSSPTLDLIYLRKVKELNPDKVFILDKPIVTQEFVDQVNVPVIWIDHHEPIILEGVKYFNPRLSNKKDARPTSYWCNEVVNDDDWLSAVGIIGDWFIPDHFNDLIKKYPDLLFKTKDPGDILFDSEFGKLVKVFSFALKGTIEEIRNNVSVLLKIESPYEILNKLTPAGKFLYKNFEKFNREYSSLLEKARECYDKKTKSLVFIYPSTKNSHTGPLSNELIHEHPNTLLIIGRKKNDTVKMSIRHSKRVLPPLIKKALDGLEGYGGGHDHACGAKVRESDFKIFVERLQKLTQK